MKASSSARGVGFSLIETAALFAAIVILSLPPVARAEQATTPKNILVVYWGSKDFPGNVIFDQNVQAVLRSSPEWIEYYTEYLDIDRFSGEKQLQLFRNYLREKYADYNINVVIANGDPALDFLRCHRPLRSRGE